MVTNGIFGRHDSWHGNDSSLLENHSTWLGIQQSSMIDIMSVYTPENKHGTQKWWIWKMFFLFSNGWFWGSMLNFGGVCPFYQASSTSSIGSFSECLFHGRKKARPFLLWNESTATNLVNCHLVVQFGDFRWFPTLSILHHTSVTFHILWTGTDN